jgi:hypothetical protein
MRSFKTLLALAIVGCSSEAPVDAAAGAAGAPADAASSGWPVMDAARADSEVDAGTGTDAQVEVPVPDWAPKVGGELQPVPTTNTFVSQNGNLPGWEWHFRKIVDDFSGGVHNPYWGPLGALVLHGGGHASTYDNSTILLDLNDLTFKRVSDPSPPSTFDHYSATDPLFDVEHCEYADGQPGAAHTYDTLAILPPSDGGGPNGSLIRVSSHAVHVNMSRDTGWSHKFDFSLGMKPSDGTWTRFSINGPTSYRAPGATSAWDSKRRRFWWIANLSSLPPLIRYLDPETRVQEDVAFVSHSVTAPPASPDSPFMRYDPVRDILVLTTTVQGSFRIAYLECSSPEQGWREPTLSEPIPAKNGASNPFDYVPEIDKHVLLSPADDAAVYELSVPAEPKDTWTVARRPFTGTTQIPVAYVSGKRWSYVPAARSILWMAKSDSGLYAYRPVGL